ncbi:hypothetical protein EK904_013644 [Melospiza melodia maxima]|nr:hypothetical protein EK904_013644 [Melospiza melodia maxima]
MCSRDNGICLIRTLWADMAGNVRLAHGLQQGPCWQPQWHLHHPTHRTANIMVYCEMSGADRGWTVSQRNWQLSDLLGRVLEHL